MTAEADQEIIEAEPPADANETEAKARRMGWRPKEEYKNDRREWIDAETFVKQAEEELPRMKHANQTMARKLDQMEKTQQEILAHQERQIAQTRKDAYEQAQRDIEARHKEAVIAGDADGAEKALKAATALKVQADTPPPAARMSSRDQDVVNEWIGDNQWYSSDPIMADYATKYEAGLAKQGIPLAERLEKTTEYIKRKFPQEFEMDDDDAEDQEPATRAPRMVNGQRSNGIRQAKPKPKAGTYEALNPEGKTACDRFVSVNGKDKAKSKAEWLRYATPDLFTQ